MDNAAVSQLTVDLSMDNPFEDVQVEHPHLSSESSNDANITEEVIAEGMINDPIALENDMNVSTSFDFRCLSK